MDSISIYNAARLDNKLNDYPLRNQDGTIKLTQGQRSILTQEKYQHISILNLKISQQENKAKSLRKEIIAFQMPSDKILADSNKEKEAYAADIEEMQDNLKILKADKQQYIDDMMTRGHIPVETPKVVEETKNPEPPKKSRLFNWRSILSFVLIWGTGEVFMTYVQYNSLRYDKAIENIVARSIAFAVVLFLIHYVAHINKTQRKIIYIIFLVFSFLMVFTMLFAPLIVNQLYPESANTAVAEQWSINAVNPPAVSPNNTAPTIIELYRRNDMIPGILSFLFFIIMISLVRKENKQVDKIQFEKPQIDAPTLQDEVVKKIAYYDMEIKSCEERLVDLKRAQKLAEHPTTDSLYNIFKALKEKSQQELSCNEERDRLVVQRQVLLNEVHGILEKYQLEFKEALNNDTVKGTLIRPEWPTENDIINFYKIRSI